MYSPKRESPYHRLSLFFCAYMHEVVPSVVAIAVRMVMAMCSTFSQNVLFAMFFSYEL